LDECLTEARRAAEKTSPIKPAAQWALSKMKKKPAAAPKSTPKKKNKKKCKSGKKARAGKAKVGKACKRKRCAAEEEMEEEEEEADDGEGEPGDDEEAQARDAEDAQEEMERADEAGEIPEYLLCCPVKANHPKQFAELPRAAWPTLACKPWTGKHSYTLSDPQSPAAKKNASITVLVNKRAFYVKPVPKSVCEEFWTGKRDKFSGVLVSWGPQSDRLVTERFGTAKALAQWT
jgi:hypothetical protein